MNKKTIMLGMEVSKLLTKVFEKAESDYDLMRYMQYYDTDSEELLEEKKAVLEKLLRGEVNPFDDEFIAILELIPKDKNGKPEFELW